MGVGIALAGGGIRGIAHAGVLKALEDNNIEIEAIGGTSAGSIVATLYAMGYKPYYIYILFKRYAQEIINIGNASLLNGFNNLLKNKKATTGVIFLCLLKCCFWYGIPYLLFKGVQFQGNPALTLSQVLAITSLSVMLAAVIPSPAGIGSTEFVFTTLFAGIVGTGMAGSASLLYRFGTFVFPFLVGTVVVLIRHFRRKKISGNRI